MHGIICDHMPVCIDKMSHSRRALLFCLKAALLAAAKIMFATPGGGNAANAHPARQIHSVLCMQAALVAASTARAPQGQALTAPLCEACAHLQMVARQFDGNTADLSAVVRWREECTCGGQGVGHVQSRVSLSGSRVLCSLSTPQKDWTAARQTSWCLSGSKRRPPGGGRMPNRSRPTRERACGSTAAAPVPLHVQPKSSLT